MQSWKVTAMSTAGFTDAQKKEILDRIRTTADVVLQYDHPNRGLSVWYW
jgi:hypothetical protein